MFLKLWFLTLLTVAFSTGDEWSTVPYKRTAATPSPIVRGRSPSVDQRPPSSDSGSLRRSQSAPSLRHISDLKLQELSEELVAKDVNNAAANVTFRHLPHGFIQMQVADQASLRNRSTYKALENLKRFYNRDLSVADSKAAAKKEAEDAFLTAVMETDVMKHLMKFLSTEGYLTVNEQGQKNWMRTIWFTPYRRGKDNVGPNSSGFEHIFLGETDPKLNKVDGMHNWFVLLLEQQLNSNQVILKEKDSEEYKDLKSSQVKGVLKKVSLTYNGFYKPSLTLAVGFSPELQMAYDTMCFLLRTDDRCSLKVGNKSFLIQNYSWYVRPLDTRVLASSYPELDRSTSGTYQNNGQSGTTRAPYRSRG